MKKPQSVRLWFSHFIPMLNFEHTNLVLNAQTFPRAHKFFPNSTNIFWSAQIFSREHKYFLERTNFFSSERTLSRAHESQTERTNFVPINISFVIKN